MPTEENDRHGYSQPTRAQYDRLAGELQQALPVVAVARQPDPRVEAMIRHDMQNQWGMEFDEWRDKRPRAYAIRVADTERLLAAADLVDPVRVALNRVRAAARHPHKGPNDTDASMLLEAAKRLEGGYQVGGSNTQATVAAVLRAVAALEG